MSDNLLDEKRWRDDPRHVATSEKARRKEALKGMLEAVISDDEIRQIESQMKALLQICSLTGRIKARREQLQSASPPISKPSASSTPLRKT